jgi:hypothetical protein
MGSRPGDDIVERALIALLKSLSGADQPEQSGRFRALAAESKARAFASAGDECKACTRVVVLERISLATVSVTWSDPTLGHFSGQVWRKGSAHINAFCALTGTPIHPGDAIFRPRTDSYHVPANANRMILESSLQLPVTED